MLNLRKILGSALALMSTGCAMAPGDVEGAQEAIIYGEPEPYHDGVVELRVGRTKGDRCSGTAISSNMILTSASCIEFAESIVLPASSIGPTEEYDMLAESWIPHPDYERNVDDPLAQAENDVAVVVFEPIRWIAPFELNHGQHDLGDGDPLTLVGFGDDLDGDWGERLSTRNTVADVYESTFTVEDASEDGGNICHRDEGGPALHRGVIAGIASSFEMGDGGSCEPSSWGFFDGAVSYYTRVDVHVDWILAQMEAYGPGSDVNGGAEKNDGVGGEMVAPGASEPAACAVSDRAPTGLGLLTLLMLGWVVRRRSGF